MKTHGWKVHPDPLDGREQAAFRGGYIVQTYGSHQGFGIDAIQLEFGADYRAKNAREKTATTLADAIAEYATKFLDITLPALPPKADKPQARSKKPAAIQVGD